LVEQLGIVGERAVAVGEATRHEELFAALGRQLGADPAAVGGRALADVHGHIVDRPAQHAHELGLGVRRDLEVQAAHRPSPGAEGLVVLHERAAHPGVGQDLAIVGLREPAARIAVALGRDKQDVGDGERRNRGHGGMGCGAGFRMTRVAGENKSPSLAVSVVIVVYNSGPTLDRCLEALKAQTFRDFEVILSDNASPDGSAQEAARRDPYLRLLENGANLGFTGGVNRGAEAARGRWLALLNPDAYAAPDWLERLMEATRRYPDVKAF